MKNSQPTKKKFYSYMTDKCGYKYNNEEGYTLLLESIEKASKSDTKCKELVELVMMNKVDRLIFRNKLAESGKEFTPSQIDEYLAIVEYALENLP
jgi:hypothetical protein